MDSVLSYKKAKIIMAGGAFAGIVTLDGKMHVWDAYDDPLGLTYVPSKLTSIAAIATGGRYILALDSTGKVWGWGDDIFSGPTIPNGLPKIKRRPYPSPISIGCSIGPKTKPSTLFAATGTGKQAWASTR